MVDKKIKKEHYEILFEDIKGKFEAIGEGIDAIRKEGRDGRKELAEKIEHNAFMIRALNEKLDKKVVELKQDIKGVEEKLDKKIDDTRIELKDEIRKVGDRVEGHEERIGILERKAA